MPIVIIRLYNNESSDNMIKDVKIKPNERNYIIKID